MNLRSLFPGVANSIWPSFEMILARAESHAREDHAKEQIQKFQNVFASSEFLDRLRLARNGHTNITTATPLPLKWVIIDDRPSWRFARVPKNYIALATTPNSGPIIVFWIGPALALDTGTG
jgi:hypothetical protein